MAPRHCRFLSLVVVEQILIFETPCKLDRVSFPLLILSCWDGFVGFATSMELERKKGVVGKDRSQEWNVQAVVVTPLPFC